MGEVIEFKSKRSFRNIALIGFMGTGKSTVGKKLARLLNWEFLDTDLEIERLCEMSVTEIFQKFGEKRFRSEETLLVKRLSDYNQFVIATGGGLMVDPENWRNLEKNALIICLYAPLDKLSERVGESSQRPLFKGKREDIEALWQGRQAVYAKADVTVDTTFKDADEVVDAILAELNIRKLI